MKTWKFIEHFDFIRQPEKRELISSSLTWKRIDKEKIEIYDGSSIFLSALKSDHGNSTYWVELDPSQNKHNH